MDTQEQIQALTAKVVELERCKHENHSIGSEAIQQIVDIVLTQLVQRLHPAPVQGESRQV